jgi:hypothetical protein
MKKNFLYAVCTKSKFYNTQISGAGTEVSLFGFPTRQQNLLLNIYKITEPLVKVL